MKAGSVARPRKKTARSEDSNRKKANRYARKIHKKLSITLGKDGRRERLWGFPPAQSSGKSHQMSEGTNLEDDSRGRQSYEGDKTSAIAFNVEDLELSTA